jgi:formate hydrogenlyase subunit 6/NADH:ubiquinone oxidoreductase subunit I
MERVNFKNVRREMKTFAGRPIPVVVTPRIRTRGTVASAIKSLFVGMRLTLGYFVRPSRIVTQQYPENRATLKFPERYRAMLRMIHDENGYHRCTGCRLCEKACPNASIKVLTRLGGEFCKIVVDRHIWRMDSCVFCNACVQACPFDALEMTHDFENAVYDRRLLVFTLNHYAGPPASVIQKQADPMVRLNMMEPCDRYGGPGPLGSGAVPSSRVSEEGTAPFDPPKGSVPFSEKPEKGIGPRGPTPAGGFPA